MDPFLTMFRREYVERIKSRSFLLITLLLLLLTTLAPILPSLLGGTLRGTAAVAVIDETGRAFPALEAALTDTLPGGLPRYRLERAVTGDVAGLAQAVRRGEKDALLVIRGDYPDALRAEWQSARLAVLGERPRIEAALNRIAQEARVRGLGLDPAAGERLLRPVTVGEVHLGARVQGKDLDARVGLAFFFVMLMYIAIIMYGSFVFQGVLEEKSSRVMEILVSSVRPFPMMAAKIAALGAVGLTQMAVWSAGWVALTVLGITLAGFDPSAIRPSLVAYLTIFYLLGYFLYAALFAAAASVISRIEDSQTASLPVAMLVILSLLVSQAAVFNPAGALALALSFVPFFTPTVMMARLAMAPPPLWQVFLSIFLLAGGVAGVAWLAGRIYQAGVLSYGQKPSAREILRYLRGV